MTIWSDPEGQEHELGWLAGAPGVVLKSAKDSGPGAQRSDMLGADGCLLGTVSPGQVTSSGSPSSGSPQGSSAMRRPAVPYSQIIRQALEASPQGRLLLREIYEWFESFHPYYTQENKGWKNSVRHTLSANKQFLRLRNERDFINKGSEWCLVDSAVGRAYANGSEGHASMQGAAWDGPMAVWTRQHLAPLNRSQSRDDTHWTSGHRQATPPHLLGVTPNPDFSCTSARWVGTRMRSRTPLLGANSDEHIDDCLLADVDQIIY